MHLINSMLLILNYILLKYNKQENELMIKVPSLAFSLQCWHLTLLIKMR